MTRAIARRFSASLIVALAVTALAPAAPTRADQPVETDVVELAADLDGSRDFPLSMPASHVAVHWPGSADAAVTIALSIDGQTFDEPQPVEIDEVGAERGDGRTYGQLVVADGAVAVRVAADRPLPDVEVLALDTTRDTAGAWGLGAVASAIVQPSVIPRAAWGADESLRFDAGGAEIWEREYFPIQKLVVHHTAMGDGDPDPAATVRAIYYYHAITQKWGDIGYNFLIDAAGRVYEGRFSRDYGGVSPSGDDVRGLGVVAGHARAYNAGSVGVALLGTFDTRAATGPARQALVRLLSWATAHHRLDPRGGGEYVNPISGERLVTPTIAGHRDYNPTACPGVMLYAQLPAIRDDIAVSLVERVAGADRYGTAAAVSATGFSPGVSTVFVATGTNFPDALAGGPAAARLGAPILLTRRDSLPEATAAEIARLAPRRIVVLGGPGAVSDAVVSHLALLAPGGVTRLAGADRYATAAAISAATFTPGGAAAFVATGTNFPDALAGGPAAGAMAAPILLTHPVSLPAATRAELTRLAPQHIYVLGGPGVVSDAVLDELRGMAPGGATRVSGADRYATAASILAFFFAQTHWAYVSVGTNFPDALAGSAPAAMRRAPIILVRGSGVPAPTADQLNRLRPPRVLVLGGTGVIPESVVAQVRAAMGLP